MALKTDYKDDILDSSVNVNRTFSIIDNTTGLTIYPNVSLEETTVFSQEGDSHTAQITNEQNTEINQLNNDLTVKYENGKTYVKENGTWVERSFGMPTLNFANPLYTFDSSHLSYIATQDCYLMGSLRSNNGTENTISVNSVNILQAYVTSGETHDLENQLIPCTKIPSGATVRLSAWNGGVLRIYKEL